LNDSLFFVSVILSEAKDLNGMSNANRSNRHPPVCVLSSLLNPVRLLLSLFSLFLAFSACAQSPPASISIDDALDRLAERLSSNPNLHGPYRLQFFEAPDFPTDAATKDQFRKGLENRHIAITDDPSAPALRIGIAETPTQLVLSAARPADKDEISLLIFPRATFRAASLPTAPVRLEKQLIYQTPDRLLDASSLWNGATTGMALLAYRSSELAVLRVDSSGAVQQSISLTAVGPLITRDPRAELSLESNAGSVLLPSRTCEFTWSNPTDAKCHETKSVWRGATVLTPSCAAGGWKLQAEGSDWTAAALLQAVPDSPAQKGSASILSDFPGPILSINGEPDPSTALVIARKLRTGDYEVYKITLACGN
jgi:hypothetical protein